MGGIANSVKRNARIRLILVGICAGGYLLLDKMAPNAYGGIIKVEPYATSNPSSGPIAKLKAKEGAQSPDPDDVLYIPPMPGDIGAYFKRGETKLEEKVIDANSPAPEDMYAEKNGGSSSGDEWWLLTMQNNAQGENHFLWKNVFAHRYGQDGVDNLNTPPEDTFDVWYVDGNWVQSGSFTGITSGIYDRLKFEFYNYSDLSRDTKVNLKDYAIFANNVGRTDPNCGADPNNLDDYSDINRNGVVDYNDLDLFQNEWLWDANDPNTW